MVPEPLVQQLKKKSWGSGDENDFMCNHAYVRGGGAKKIRGCPAKMELLSNSYPIG